MSSDRELIEPRIVQLVRQYAAAPAVAATPASCMALMDATARQAVSSSEGGKRLRALLLLDAYDAFTSGNDSATAVRSAALDVACGIELFQTAALIHDDIIDEADMRRGMPAAHRALAGAAHSDAVGTGLGIMLGDLLATASVAVVEAAAGSLPHRDAIMSMFLTMHREVEFGQMLDLAVEHASLSSPDELAEASLTVFRWKTASYTTIAPLALAMVASGMAPEQAQREALAIGHPLGVAFQLADDLLDVTGSTATTGKPVGGDIREGKRTVLLADALAAASPAERQTLIRLYTAPARSTQDVQQVIDLFGTTGALDRSRSRITALWIQTQQAIAALHLTAETADALTRACARFIPAVLR